MTPPAAITGLYRYPVKGLSPEPLQRVALDIGQTFPADRRYAIENGPSGFDPAAPVWRPKSHYLMLMRNERLAGYRTLFDDRTGILTVRKDGEVVAAADLESAEGRREIERFFATRFADDLKGPPKLLTGGGHSFSDDVRNWSPSSISRASPPSKPWSAPPSTRFAFAPTSISAAGPPGMSSIWWVRPSPSATSG